MINNVLEEIKRLRIERFEKANPINLHPKHYNMHIDKVANETTKYYKGIKGEHARNYHFNSSNYEDSLRKDKKTHFSAHNDKTNGNYMNKLYGIPSNLKFSNNDNTLYYENNLGNKSESDFQAENFNRSEMKDVLIEHQIDNNLNKKMAIKYIMETLKNKRQNKEDSSGEIRQIKLAKNIKNPPISKIAPSPVTVSPAFNTPVPDNIVYVQPVTDLEKVKKSMKNREKQDEALKYLQNVGKITTNKAKKALYDKTRRILNPSADTIQFKTSNIQTQLQSPLK